MPGIIRNKIKANKVQVITYLTEKEKEQFKAKCKAEGNTASSVLREYVLEFIK
ncbi:MAG: hypothetical protein AAGE84_14060 [Cyanobacteria bacterium P01_G01_bin.39]